MLEIDTPNDDEFNKGRFQVMNLTNQTELNFTSYPICISDCVKDDRKDNRVFTSEELKCTNNCINKYRTSL